MDSQLKQYIDKGQHLPYFLKDFHDQKTLFKRLQEMVDKRNDGYTNDVNWISAQVYTIDVFLWFMACHGYTLQQSRKQVPFYSIEHDLSEFEKRQDEIRAEILKSMVSDMQSKNPQTSLKE